MSREWKPGDVAMVSAYNRREPYRAYYDGKTWREHEHDMFCVDVPETFRPLVVIDPEDREQVERFVTIYFGEFWKSPEAGRVVSGPADVPRTSHIDSAQAALREFANPTPPKPDEPQGLGAVVEDDMGRHWVSAYRDGGSKWVGTNGPSPRDYADIPAVRILSEGITP